MVVLSQKATAEEREEEEEEEAVTEEEGKGRERGKERRTSEQTNTAMSSTLRKLQSFGCSFRGKDETSHWIMKSLSQYSSSYNDGTP